VINEITESASPAVVLMVDAESIPTVKNGLGIARSLNLTGIMTDATARQSGIGGELLCTVW